MSKLIESKGEVLFYQTEDGLSRVDVHLVDETVWLTQAQIADLFQKDVRTISEHISNIYEENELLPEATIRNFRIVQKEGSRDVVRAPQFYSLDVIISVGYRVKSHRGTQFRIWATQQLREYIVKGFVMDDERLKNLGGGKYFDGLLARIRDIRSSEKVFWRKVLEIYATSIDYDPKNDLSVEFFKIVQNKMHWAAHGHTAAEVIDKRVDAAKPNMGLTTWPGKKLRKSDVGIAKNYLEEKEIKALNLIVSLYLDFAELQALDRKPMTMSDWIAKLDDFLKLSSREILKHAGKISHKAALTKAEKEYEKYALVQVQIPSSVERHFEESILKIRQIEKKVKSTKGKK